MAVAAKSARFKAMAERMIGENATKAVIRQTINSGPEWAPEQIEVDTDCEVVPTDKTQADIDGTLIGVDTRKYLLSTAAGVTPKKSDKMVFNLTAAEVTEDTIFFEIVQLKPISLGASDIVYEVWVKT